MSRFKERQAELGEKWLLFAHQLPAQPAYLRVKLWRRLQAIGAVPIKNGLHALPSTPDTLEDFEWLMREASSGGGEATIIEARLVDGLTDEELRELFNSARSADYGGLAREAEELASTAASLERARSRDQLSRLKTKLSLIAKIDFFGSKSRDQAETALIQAARSIEERPDVQDKIAASAAEYRNKTWVTRSGVYVDRIASAWLIRCFVDPEARFKFVPVRGYGPRDGEIRFDMFEAEFSHIGDACTMEVLVQHFLPDDDAAHAVAEIVHDIDLKDAKFGRPEAAGIRTLISGICAQTSDDDERVERGFDVFQNLYAFFQGGAR